MDRLLIGKKHNLHQARGPSYSQYKADAYEVYVNL
jgi:hypothetical protein